MRFKLFSATRSRRAVSPGIGLLIIGLWSLGCGGSASRGSASDPGAQPAAESEDEKEAVVVVRDYLDALDEGDLVRAYAHWWSERGLGFDESQRQRANIAAVQADIGKPRYVHRSDNRQLEIGGTRYTAVGVLQSLAADIAYGDPAGSHFM